MKITVWGCRGSMPSPGPDKIKYGGNTSCVQIENDDTCLIFDGGSGIQNLGSSLNPNIRVVNILLTHLHIDHVMGLGYFTPLYNPKCTVNIWGPAGSSESLIKRLRRYFSPPFFPVRLNELSAKINITEIENSTFQIDDFNLTAEYLCHPGPTFGYRCELDKSVVSYIPDHEPALGSSDFPNLSEWCSGYNIAREADLLFHDSQYTREQYDQRIGWGHSSIDDAIDFGALAKVKKLVLFHHDPTNTDTQLERMFDNAVKTKNINFDLSMGKENDVFSLE
jgi:phosphoribosyl 1,2-cyclic phosphodiesterase